MTNADLTLFICVFLLVFGSYLLGIMHRKDRTYELEIALDEAIQEHGFESPEAITAAKRLEDYTG